MSLNFFPFSSTVPVHTGIHLGSLLVSAGLFQPNLHGNAFGAGECDRSLTHTKTQTCSLAKRRTCLISSCVFKHHSRSVGQTTTVVKVNCYL